MAALRLTISHSNLRVLVVVLAASAAAIATAPALAGDHDAPFDGPKDSSVIGDAALSQAKGAVMVNQAAGGGNAQQNSAALAVGPKASATGASQQRVISSDSAVAPWRASTQIAPRAMSNSSGMVLVNQTAGHGNAQQNVSAIAIGDQATATLVSKQQVESAGSNPLSASIDIGSQAFSNAQGWIAINQSAGQGNAQTNSLVLGGAVVTLSDVQLAQVGTSSNGAGSVGDRPDGSRTAKVDAQAFSGAGGIIQVNQSAGRGSVTANRVNVRLGVAAP